jgi:hypothetical protein
MMIERSSYLRIVYETIRRNSVSMHDDQVSDIPYRNGPRRQTESNSASDNTKQTPITQFFDKEPSIPVSRKRSRSAGGASQSSSALMTTSDDVDSNDDYVTEQEVDSHDEQDSD